MFIFSFLGKKYSPLPIPHTSWRMCLLDSKIGETVRTTQEQAVMPFLKCGFLGFLKGTSELVQYHHLNNQFGDYLSKLISVGCLANWNQREKKERVSSRDTWSAPYFRNAGPGINTIEQYHNWAQTSVGRIFLKAQLPSRKARDKCSFKGKGRRQRKLCTITPFPHLHSMLWL